MSWFGRLVGGNVGFEATYKLFEVITLPGRLPVTLWNKRGVFFLRVCSIIDNRINRPLLNATSVSCAFSDGHRSDWTKRRFQRSPVAEHFKLHNHDFNSHVSLCCIDHDAQWSDDSRKARESYWVRRLNTIQPHGINKGD